MIYQEYDINHARGIRLFESVRLDGLILEKGHILDDEDIIQLKLSGIKKIFGAEMSENDLDGATALGVLSAKLCGSNTAYAVTPEGISQIIAQTDGVFLAADERIAKFNRLFPDIILNTIPPYSEVKAGEIIAELELTVPVIMSSKIDEIVFSLSGNIALLQVAEPKERKVTLLYTKFYNDKLETAHFTGVVPQLVKDFKNLKLDFAVEHEAKHEIEKVADVLEVALKGEGEVIFIISGQRNSQADDVISAALKSVADEVIVTSIPQIGASDLLIALKRGKKIISLPFNYATQNNSLANHYIKLALLNDKITPEDFKHPQNVQLSQDKMFDTESGLELIKASSDKGKNAKVAAIVLAAGSSRRAGRNKLLYEVDDAPLFLKAVHAAVFAVRTLEKTDSRLQQHCGPPRNGAGILGLGGILDGIVEISYDVGIDKVTGIPRLHQQFSIILFYDLVVPRHVSEPFHPLEIEIGSPETGHAVVCTSCYGIVAVRRMLKKEIDAPQRGP